LECPLKIDFFVAQIIKTPNFDNFTTSDVRSSYITMSNDASIDLIAIRRKIYAELLKLVKKGWLIKKSSNKKKGTRFKKTELFDAIKLITDITTKNTTLEDYDNIKQSLTTKLNHYKTELLLNIGESEAYKELYDEFPQLGENIQSNYNKARDNNTKILGKIKAIEYLINQDKG
jgi:hypothetical protein